MGTYLSISKKKECGACINLRYINVRKLLFLSTTGMVCFSGYGSKIFNFVGAAWAKVKVNALLPNAKVADLVEVGFLEDL